LSAGTQKRNTWTSRPRAIHQQASLFLVRDDTSSATSSQVCQEGDECFAAGAQGCTQMVLSMLREFRARIAVAAT
jgi:hypothetical protein